MNSCDSRKGEPEDPASLLPGLTDTIDVFDTEDWQTIGL
jgi:hypothetical protein